MFDARRARAAFQRAAEQWIEDAAEHLLDQARRDADPGGGPLANSGRIEVVEAQGNVLVVAVVFGGTGAWGDVPYAAAQHRGRMVYRRDGNLIRWVVRKRPSGGRAGYLSRNLKALPPTMHELGEAALRRELRG